MKQPIDKNGNAVTVGSNLVRGQQCDTIIRIDDHTEQVWYKNGGFNWFEEIKYFTQHNNSAC